MDAKLSWNFNASYVSRKATKVLIFCAVTCTYTCRASSKQKAFWVLVIPVLDYASTVWNPHTNKNSIALERITAGFVGPDFVFIPIDGLDHLKNVVWG